MTKALLRPCPICTHETGDVLHTQRFVLPEGHPLASGYDVLCCDGCGFVFADTTVTQRDYDLFYAQFSKYEDKSSTGAGESGWDRDRLRLTAETIANFLPRRDARILDIGCANGGMLRALGEMGFYQLAGIDPSPACAANARKNAGAWAETGGLFNLPAGIGRFDCVILSHVLEHVQELRAAIQVARHLTADEGIIYLEVPDAARYDECLTAPFQDFNTEHINHFSPASLMNLAIKASLLPLHQGTKTLLSPPPLPYPAAFLVCTRPPGSMRPTRVRPDTQLRERIENYIRVSADMMRDFDLRLRNALAKTPEVIVWGTGQLAMKLLLDTALADANIVAFVDGNAINQGKKLLGKPILAPSAVREFTQPIVITTTIHQEAIVDTIRQKLRLPNAIITLKDTRAACGEVPGALAKHPRASASPQAASPCE